MCKLREKSTKSFFLQKYKIYIIILGDRSGFMTDDTLEQYRNSFYESILLLQDEQDILESLPSPEYQSFFSLMEGLISKLVEECREFQSLGDDSDILDEVESLKKKINICRSRLEIVKKQIAIDNIESQATCSKRHLIFAQTTFGSTFLQKDLKDIPKEYYDKVLATLETLESGDFNSNTEKVRQLTNNKKLFGLYEIKEFKIRLVYRVLDGDMVYVMQTRMKKDDNSSLDQKDLINRNRNTNDEFKMLQERVQNPHERDLLIMEHENIRNEIFDELEAGKRDGKGGKK